VLRVRPDKQAYQHGVQHVPSSVMLRLLRGGDMNIEAVSTLRLVEWTRVSRRSHEIDDRSGMAGFSIVFGAQRLLAQQALILRKL
jgi:hypothetical protein